MTVNSALWIPTCSELVLISAVFHRVSVTFQENLVSRLKHSFILAGWVL